MTGLKDGGKPRGRAGRTPALTASVVWAAAGLVVMTATGLAANVLITRSLPPREVGVYFVCVSLVMVLAVIARAGLDYGVISFTGVGLARDETGVARGSIMLSLQIVSVLATLTAALVVLVWSAWISEFAVGLGILVGLLLVADSVRQVASEAFRGFGDIPRASAYGNALRGVLFLGFLGAGRLLWSDLDLARCLQASVIASAATCAWALFALMRRLRTLGPPSAVARGPILRQSLPMMATSLAGLILSQGAVLVVGGLLDARSAALYGAALRVALLLEAPLFVANAVVLPIIVRLHAVGDSAALEHVLRRAATVISLAMLGALVVLIVGGQMLMRTLFGPFFAGAAPVLAILAGAQLVNSLAGSSGITLSMTGNERAAMLISSVSAVAAVLLEVILGQMFGINGVAIGAAVGIAAANIVMVAAVRARLGIVPAASFAMAWGWATRLKGGGSATT